MQTRLVLLTGILPFQTSIFNAIKEGGGRIAYYLTDDPWNPVIRRRSFLRNLCHYEHIYSTKQALCERLEKAWTPSTSWLPCAYDPALHQQPLEKSKNQARDALFVGTGTGAAERLPWLEVLKDLPGVRRRIHGNNWGGLKTPSWDLQPAVTGETYCQEVHNAGIVLGLLRQANGELTTDRSYEIGAIGGCGLYQDSSEHRTLLPNYPDEGFFSTPAKFRERVNHLLENPGLLERLAKELENGRVIGWFNGPMEFGPRSLGSKIKPGQSAQPEDAQRNEPKNQI